jgi:hypothetical protein
MEAHAIERRALLPTKKVLAMHSIKQYASKYWEVIQACL